MLSPSYKYVSITAEVRAKIHNDGEKILKELAQSNDCYYHKLLSRKMDEISNSLSQRNLHRFMESLHVDSGPDYPIRDPHRIYANELVYVEKALADEINFLFYIFFYIRDPLDRDRAEPLYIRYFPDMVKPNYIRSYNTYQLVG